MARGLQRTEAGEAHGDAVSYADGVVENAQTSGFLRSLGDRARHPVGHDAPVEFVRAWTALASYMIAKGNIAFERVRGTDYRSPVQVANLIGDLMLLFTVEAVLAGVIRGTLPEMTTTGGGGWPARRPSPWPRPFRSSARCRRRSKGFAVGGGPGHAAERHRQKPGRSCSRARSTRR